MYSFEAALIDQRSQLIIRTRVGLLAGAEFYPLAWRARWDNTWSERLAMSWVSTGRRRGRLIA